MQFGALRIDPPVCQTETVFLRAKEGKKEGKMEGRAGTGVSQGATNYLYIQFVTSPCSILVSGHIL